MEPKNCKKFIPEFDKSCIFSLDTKKLMNKCELSCSVNKFINTSQISREKEQQSEEKTSKDSSNKQLKDFVSYLKQTRKNTTVFSSDFNMIQNEYENLKGALKKRLFSQKPKSSFESKENQLEKNHDETLNASKIVENSKKLIKINKNQAPLQKILLNSKNFCNNIREPLQKTRHKTLKKGENLENFKEIHEKTTNYKRNKCLKSSEDEFLELLNRSCLSISNKKKAMYSERESPSLLLDTEPSSNKKAIRKNCLDNRFIASSCERRVDVLSDKLRKEKLKRRELEQKINKSMKEIDSVKIKLKFLEESHKKSQFSSVKKNSDFQDSELINCCLTSQKKNSVDSFLSNIKVSEFKMDDSIENTNKNTKYSDLKSRKYLNTLVSSSKEMKTKLMNGFRKILGTLENDKTQEIHMENLTSKISQTLNIYRKVKQKFNKKFENFPENSKILQNNSIFSNYSVNNSKKSAEKDAQKLLLQIPTFSFSEYNINNITNFSNILN